MSKTFWIHVMIVMTVLLATGPLLGHAAGPGAVDHGAGQALSSGTGTPLVCAFQPERAAAEYYRGRAGEFTRRAGRVDLLNKGRLVCRDETGAEVKSFTGCQF